MPNYVSTYLEDTLVINKIVTVHYFEYTRDFFFPGESHNFWEFLYVDKGEVEVVSGTLHHILKKGDIIFHKPMEFHSLHANGVTAPNLVVIAFECYNPAIFYLENKLLKLNDSEHSLLSRAVKESQDVFCSAFDDPNLLQLEKKPDIPFGAEQLIKLYLELMLLELIRRDKLKLQSPKKAEVKISLSIKEKKDRDLLSLVLQYLEENVYNSISYDDVCKSCFIGRSYLQKIFSKQMGSGVMEYFNKLKIEKAKQHIRESSKNFTEISELLGYKSIHYFSRYFKKSTGMTPSEYASSVKALSENITIVPDPRKLK